MNDATSQSRESPSGAAADGRNIKTLLWLSRAIHLEERF
jgi:hypothetical protein